jgi:hypothetical protein
MMTLTTEQLDKLTREDLLALVIRQQEIIALLQAEVAALKAELEKFRRPPATSRNGRRRVEKWVCDCFTAQYAKSQKEDVAVYKIDKTGNE